MKDTNKSSASALCPICGEGHVTDGMAMTGYEYKGKATSLPLRFTTCDTCGSESAGLEESRANKRAAMAFRKSVDCLLTGVEICALRSKYKLTQNQAAKLFGGGPVAFSKYENDDVAQSEAMDTLLRLVFHSEAAFWELVDQKGMAAELSFKRQARVGNVFRKTQTNVIYIHRAAEDMQAVHTAQSHQYAAYSVETSSAHKTWKR